MGELGKTGELGEPGKLGTESGAERRARFLRGEEGAVMRDMCVRRWVFARWVMPEREFAMTLKNAGYKNAKGKFVIVKKGKVELELDIPYRGSVALPKEVVKLISVKEKKTT